MRQLILFLSFAIIFNSQCYRVTARKLAKSIDNRSICMSECSEGTCKTGRYETSRTKCKVTDEEVPTYFTSGYNQREEAYCVGDCAKAGFMANWCFTSTGEWDLCSRDYGKSAAGGDCHTHCQINDKSYYTCTRDFNTTTHYDEACSPVALDKPADLHMVASLDNHKGTCMSTCNGYCYFSWKSWEWDYCTPTSISSLQYFTTGSDQKKTKLCSGECSIAGYQNYWCFTVNRNEWDYCSPSEGTTFNYKRCFSDCRIKETSYFTCITNPTDERQYERCSPKPLDQAKIFEFNQDLEKLAKSGSTSRVKLIFPKYFHKLENLFHKTIINGTANGEARVTYYHDYVDGVKIVRGVDAMIERKIILNKTIAASDTNFDLSFYLQALESDSLGYFIEPLIGGSTSDDINRVPLKLHTTFELIQTNIRKKVENDEKIVRISLIILPYYSFNGHRPLGFLIRYDYEFDGNEVEDNTRNYLIVDNSFDSYSWDLLDDDAMSSYKNNIWIILHIIVVMLGLIGIFVVFYQFYVKK